MFQNPSFASFLPVYSWAADFKALGEGRGRVYNVSVMDGMSQFFQAAAAYTVRDELTAVHISASKKIHPRIAFGIAGKLFFSRNKGSIDNSKNINLSATGAPFDWFQLAFIADNLLTPSATSQLGLERELVLGTKFKASEKLLFYIDPRTRLGDGLKIPSNPRFGYEVGSEVAIFKDLFLRVGTFKNISHPDVQTKANGFAYGIGWIAPKISFDFAMERIRVPQDRSSLTSGMTIYF
ncbi:MAG: hypothetical protein KGQ59_01875 [Bdellovibrionales bacterium]|nr:hypothetical protein [Bdellovibrionales bacterium]